VAECAVIGVADEIKGEIPLGTIVLKAGANRPEEEVVQELIQMVREEQIGPVASVMATLVTKLSFVTRVAISGVWLTSH
jgi:propionyl-CoA synthetase